jgi:hypothetical protein
MSNRGNCSPIVTNCTFSGNSSGWAGGGMYNYGSCSPTVTNCIFSGNLTGGWGGGMYNETYSSPTLTNCTFSGNSAGQRGGGMCNFAASSPTLKNCILWSNRARYFGPQIFNYSGCRPNVSYSDVQGGWPGTGNIDVEPCFVGPRYGGTNEGLIAHWKLNESQGSTAHDSAAENDGTVHGAEWTPGKLEGAMSFDGVDDYVDVADNPSLDITDEITLAAWIYKTGLESGVIAMKKEGNCLQYGFGLGQDKLTFDYRTQCGSGVFYQHTYRSHSSISSNTWHHVAVRYESGNSTSAALYLDGVEISGSWTPLGDGTGEMASMPSYLTIGRTEKDHGAPQSHFKGKIDDVRIYDRALSAEEIRQFYQSRYHLLPTSPCIDAGDNTAVPADTLDLDNDGDTEEPIPIDLAGNPRFVDQPEVPDTGNGNGNVCEISNGGFENGEFSPWTTVTGPGDELEPWNVTSGDTGFYENGFPFEGEFFAQNGFDGSAGLYYEIYQEVEIHPCSTSAVLSWTERIQWDMVSQGATLAKEYVVSLQPSGGGAPLAVLYSLFLLPETSEDTGYVTHSIDLLDVAPGISGQTVRINFYQYIPENFTGPAQFDLDGISLTLNCIDPIVDMGAYEPNFMELAMKCTPQALNLDSQGRWLMAHLVLPEGFSPNDVDVNTPAVIEPLGIESDHINAFINEDGLVEIEVAFIRSHFCRSETSVDDTNIMVIAQLKSGRLIYGTDTIKISGGVFEFLAVFVSHWLETDCSPPDWCSGLDLDQDSIVNFIDYAMFDTRCCIEVVEE